MSFPIYRHDMPWDDWRDTRARRGSKKNVEALSNDRPSIWKRELSLGRKKDVRPEDLAVETAESEQTPTDEPATEQPRSSIWKRELSLGKKKKEKSDEPTSEEVVEPDAADADERPSIWKRDLSFGRKKKDEPVAAEVAVSAAEPELEDETVVEVEPALEAPDPVALPEPAAEEPAETWYTRGWQPVEAVEPAAPETALSRDPEPVAAAPSEDVPALEPEPQSFESEAPRYDFARVEPEAPVAEPEVGVAPEPVAKPIPAAVEPVLEAEAVAETTSEPAERVPFWKREIGGKKKSKKQKGSDWEFDTAAEATPAEAVATVAVDAVAADDSVDEPASESKKRRRGKTKEKKVKQPRVKGNKGSRGAKKIVGLRIGASQISAAHVQTNGHHELLKMARTPLERGVVVAGELRDPDALAAALRVFFKQNKLPKQGIRLGIASNRVGVRVLEVHGVEDEKLLGNAVSFRAQEVLPIPLSEAVLDYRVLRERTEEDGSTTREVLVAFAYRELVDRYLGVCRSAGLRLVGIDLDGFALLRALVDPADTTHRDNGAAVVTVALGHDRSIMSVTDGELCEFTRVIEWGGASLDTAVARVLALTPSQAEPIKRALTLDRYAEPPEGLTDEQASRARSAMTQEVHAFAREFVSSLQFYQAQPGSLDIGEIVVTGGTAHMPGLVEQLQELIGVAVRIGDPLGRVRLAKGLTTDEPVGSLALAIGLGIED